MNYSRNTQITTNMGIKVTTHQHLLTCHNRVISSWNSSFSFTHLPACGQQDFTSLYCCTSQLTQPFQLIIWQLFCFTTPTPKKFKTISNHFSPFSFQPYFLQTTNMNTTSFQSLKYFTQFSQHRSHISCWKRDSKLYIKRSSNHSSTSALNFF